MTKGHTELFWSIANRNMDTAKIQVGRSIPGFYSAAQPTPAQRGVLQLFNYFDAADISYLIYGARSDE